MTRGLITEQIYRLYNQFKPTADANLEKADIRPLIDQVVNTIIKTEHFGNAAQFGWDQPDGLVIATYPNLTIDESESGVHKVILPVMPASLIRNVGVWQVSPSTDLQTQYIPMQPSQYALLRPVTEMWMIKNLTTYEVFGKEIRFNRTLTGVSKITVRLIVRDTLSLSDNDLMPIPADKVGAVVEEVLKMLGVNRGAVGDTAQDNRDENG